MAICTVSQKQADGKDIGFWVSGHLVYGVCVFVANTIILTRTKNFTGYGEGLNALMNFAYFFFMLILSSLASPSFSALNHIFENMFSIWNIWLAILLTVGFVTAGEFAFRAYLFRAWDPNSEPDV
jgi:membrane protease YdiL (CAAX protease family)